ncbi:hypothetical protein BS17DRAFT_766102 [Gyrodon lividus]|nr:hypothetical protein BS17DRAFT_766102 [Gyrodon lividus]
MCPNSTPSPTKATHLIQEMHHHHLQVPLSSIPRPRSLHWFSHLDNNKETKRLRIKVQVHSKDIKHNVWGRSVILGSDNVPITNDQDQFVLVVILELGKQVNHFAQGHLSSDITGHLANDEFVVVLGYTRQVGCITKGFHHCVIHLLVGSAGLVIHDVDEATWLVLQEPYALSIVKVRDGGDKVGDTLSLVLINLSLKKFNGELEVTKMENGGNELAGLGDMSFGKTN